LASGARAALVRFQPFEDRLGQGADDCDIAVWLLSRFPVLLQSCPGRTIRSFEDRGHRLRLSDPRLFRGSGIKFDLDALLGNPGSLVMLPVFLALFLVVRGLPALWFYLRELGRNDRLALGLFGATALPPVIAITDLGVESHHMTAAMATALV
jgi:hypothetical protein